MERKRDTTADTSISPNFWPYKLSEEVPIANLVAAIGGPSQCGFGSAVFIKKVNSNENLETRSIETYKYFVGPLWQRFGEDAWMTPWREIFSRKGGAHRDILAELLGIQDRQSAAAVSMILNSIDGAGVVQIALSAVFDNALIDELHVYKVGDGQAISGILVCGYSRLVGEAVFLIFLMD